MATTRTIEIQLPEHLDPETEDIDLLRATLQALVGVRYEQNREWKQALAHLRSAGWQVEWSLQWHVMARRGREMEEACGVTRDQAFLKLDHMVRAESFEGTP